MSGILLLDKPEGYSSFFFIPRLRRLLSEKKIGHAGTLDPFASGLVVYLIGKEYTRLAQSFLEHDKEYFCHFHLGIQTDTYDLTGVTTYQSSLVPSKQQVSIALEQLSARTEQTPPMFSAKKQQGHKLYELARKGVSVQRSPCPIKVSFGDIYYSYPKLELRAYCSKGTYIRALANDLGQILGCGAHVSLLRRFASGPFHLENAIPSNWLYTHQADISQYLLLHNS